MGSKTRARELMQAAGVPIVPGTTAPVESVEAARAGRASEFGYPIAVKAAGGGGGKGFRVALGPDELGGRVRGRRARGGEVLLRPDGLPRTILPDPRHVEVQVLADEHGAVDSPRRARLLVQRRHQKLVEESPARSSTPRCASDRAVAVDWRARSAIAAPGRSSSCSADGEYFFLEMNTRVQVEHTVTETVTGIDIVREQLRIAAGEPLWVTQDQVALRGHAIECRINAEDPAPGFAPAPGTLASIASRPARACASTRACSPARRSRPTMTCWSPS